MVYRYLYEHRTAACSGQAIAFVELPRHFKLIVMRRLGFKTFEQMHHEDPDAYCNIGETCHHFHVSDVLWLALNYIFLITWYFLQYSCQYFLSSRTRDESVCGKEVLSARSAQLTVFTERIARTAQLLSTAQAFKLR